MTSENPLHGSKDRLKINGPLDDRESTCVQGGCHITSLVALPPPALDYKRGGTPGRTRHEFEQAPARRLGIDARSTRCTVEGKSHINDREMHLDAAQQLLGL